MPITKSAKKALSGSKAKYVHNEKQRKELDKALKKVNEKTFSKVVSLIDKAVKNNLFHPNKASRMKSAIAKKIDIKKVQKREGAGETQTKKKKSTKKASSKKVK